VNNDTNSYLESNKVKGQRERAASEVI